MVAARGTGTIRIAPQRSTIHRCCYTLYGGGQRDGYYQDSSTEIHNTQMLDQHKVRVPSLELIEANVEDDGDVAGEGAFFIDVS